MKGSISEAAVGVDRVEERLQPMVVPDLPQLQPPCRSCNFYIFPMFFSFLFKVKKGWMGDAASELDGLKM